MPLHGRVLHSDRYPLAKIRMDGSFCQIGDILLKNVFVTQRRFECVSRMTRFRDVSTNARRRTVPCRLVFPDSPEFERLVAGADDVHLARIALEIARDAHPELDIESYLQKIERLAERARDRCRPGSKVRDILGQINWVLFVEAGLRANEEDYYDPRNSYLNEVLDRGLGIPISLSLVYWAVGERLGVALAGANLPLHFMLRFEEDGLIWFVDPFRGGAIYNRENCERKLSEIVQQPVVLTDSLAAPCAIRVVVARMLRNLKVIYGRQQEIASLLPVQRRLAALSP